MSHYRSIDADWDSEINQLDCYNPSKSHLAQCKINGDWHYFCYSNGGNLINYLNNWVKTGMVGIKFDTGLQIVSWLKDGVFHRDGGPAEIILFSDSIMVSWYKKGILVNRIDGDLDSWRFESFMKEVALCLEQ